MKVLFEVSGILALRLCFSAFIFAVAASAQGLPVAAPQSVGMDPQALARIDEVVNADIAAKKLPGAVVIVGHKGKIVYRKAFGNRSLVPTVEKMTVDTIFDVASLTKPVATATSIMILVEQGKLRLNDTIGKFIPDIDDSEAKKVTIQQLLTHTSGYRPDFDLGEKWTGREGMLAALKKEKLRNPPGTRFVYSDIGFSVLGEIVQRVAREPLDSFVYSTFEPIRVRPGFGFWSRKTVQQVWGLEGGRSFDEFISEFAPTESVRGQNSYLGLHFNGDEQSGARILR